MAWFRISFAKNAFTRLLTHRGLAIESMSIDDGVAAMQEFYAQHRAQHADLADDGDMLLLQWGAGELSITRRMVRSGGGDTPTMQLRLSFTVDAVLPAAGSVWQGHPAAPIVVPSFFTGVPTGATLDYEAC